MSSHSPVNVLLVDDQPSKLLSYEVILNELGEKLIKASSAREALECLLKTEVAVVLVDVCMPDVDGFEFARILREHPRFEKTAIIFISAIHLSDLDHVRGYESGAVDYVSVPVVPEILRAKVRIFVELHRKTKQLEALNNELERRVAERTAALEASTAQLKESEERLRLASEAAGFGTYDYDIGADQVFWSPSLRRIVGVEADEPLTIRMVLEWVHPDHRDMVRRHIRAYAPDAGRWELEFRIVRPDGEIRWLLDRGQAIASAGENGSPARHAVGTILDITERKQSEEHQRLLLAELDHRVKNILGNVSAMARLSGQRASSVRLFVEALDGRIQAMSRAHSLLRHAGWRGADLPKLVAEVLSPYCQSKDDRIAFDGPSIWIVPELAQSLALILNELATNAFKHGSLSVRSGRVRISWAREARTGHIRLVWRESGISSPPEPVTRGFGLTVLEAAVSNIGGTVEFAFEKDGLVYALQGPFEFHQRGRPLDHETEVPSQGRQSTGDARVTPSRILVVEDEVLIALQLQGDLEADGHQVIGPARSLAEATALAQQADFDLALLDVRLGQDTSTALADELLERNVPFAFTTGYAEADVVPEHLRSIPRLIKPYALDRIRCVVEELTDAIPLPLAGRG
jgi:PAS domain S-box-containing protein